MSFVFWLGHGPCYRKRHQSPSKIKATEQSGGRDREQVHRSQKPEANIPTRNNMGYPKRSPRMASGLGVLPSPPREGGPREIRACCIGIILEFSDFSINALWLWWGPVSQIPFKLLCVEVRTWFIWLEQEKLPQKDETSFGKLAKAFFGLDVSHGIPTCGKNLTCYLSLNSQMTRFGL